LSRSRKKCGWGYLKMALDGFSVIRRFRLQLKASCRLPMENYQWWKILAIVDSQKVFSIRPEKGLVCNLMFSVRVKTCTSRHKTKCAKAAKMIAARKPLDTTGGQCQKSPPKITTLPPKGESGRCMMSRKVRSIASAQCRCCVGASSQTISFASRSYSAKSLCIDIKHIEY
jgi:hypothetical protein